MDAKGVPTLVEVKRRGDTRGRREVVAQMLDYAANARTSFSADLLREWLEEAARKRDKKADDVLVEDLGIDAEGIEGYWETVDTNLQAEHFRLVFVSDRIGRTLRRIIEYLAQQMKTTELLAIEVKQYVDDDGKHQTIVPRVIGATSEKDPAQGRLYPREAPGGHCRPPGGRAARRRCGRGGSRLGAEQGASHPLQSCVRRHRTRSPQRPLLRVSRRGNIRLELRTLRKHGEPWNDDSIQQLRGELDLESAGDSPKASPGSLTDKNRREEFFNRMEEVLGTLTVKRAANDPSAPQPA